MAPTLIQPSAGRCARLETDCLEQVIDEIRGLLAQWGLPADRLDRRSRRRFPYPHLIRVSPVGAEDLPADATLVASGRDISLYGIGFYLPEPLPYQKAVITFNRSLNDALSILTELDWCRFTRYGWYENGGRFLRIVGH